MSNYYTPFQVLEARQGRKQMKIFVLSTDSHGENQITEEYLRID